MGGAMDLVVGARRLIVLTDHVAKDGSPKIVEECTLPLTGRRVTDRVITDRADFAIDEHGLILTEVAPGVSIDEVRRLTAAPFRLALREKETTS